MADPKTGSAKAAGQSDTALPTSNVDPGAPERDAGGRDVQPVSTDMQAFIGRQLRAVFDDIAKQPVPDRFLELMRQLEEKSGTGVA